MNDEVSLKEFLLAIINERDKQVALALAALAKNRSETVAMLALFVALLTAVAEFFHR
jgi:hypothetical protein